MSKTIVFEGSGEFEALNRAKEWCRANGYSYGALQAPFVSRAGFNNAFDRTLAAQSWNHSRFAVTEPRSYAFRFYAGYERFEETNEGFRVEALMSEAANSVCIDNVNRDELLASVVATIHTRHCGDNE